MVVVAGVAGWWLSRQGLMAKPWLEQGLTDDMPGVIGSTPPTAKIGLGVFLGRRQLSVRASHQRLFDANAGVRLAAAADTDPAVGQHGAVVPKQYRVGMGAGGRAPGRDLDVRAGLVAGGISALAFLVGQLLAWRQFDEAGLFRGHQSSQLVLLPRHRRARAPRSGRPGGPGQDNCHGFGRSARRSSSVSV